MDQMRVRCAVLSCVFLLVVSEARAGSLFVDDDGCDEDARTAAPSCAAADGTSGHPYATIGAAAVAANDATRFRSGSTVVIHVAEGRYGEAGTVALDRAHTRIVGVTRLPSTGGFPDTPVGPQSSILWPSNKASTFLVTADDVRIEGLTFVGPGGIDPQSNGLGPTVDIAGNSPTLPSSPADDLIGGVEIRGCAFLGGRVAIRSTHANLTVEGSFATGHFNTFNLLAGPAGGGQTVVVEGNRIVDSQVAAIIVHGQSAVAGRAGEQYAEIHDNDLSHGGRRIALTPNDFGTGIQIFGANDSGPGQPIPAPNQLLPAFVSVDVHDNVFTENRNYGITINNRASGPFSSPSTLIANVQDNEFCGNGNNDVLVSSLFFWKALCPDLGGALRHVVGAHWDVTLGDGVGWDYDVGPGNPGITVNGAVLDDAPFDPNTPASSSITPWPFAADYCMPLTEPTMRCVRDDRDDHRRR